MAKGDRELAWEVIGDLRAGLDYLRQHHPEACRGYIDAIWQHRIRWGLNKPAKPIETILEEYDKRLEEELHTNREEFRKSMRQLDHQDDGRFRERVESNGGEVDW